MQALNKKESAWKQVSKCVPRQNGVFGLVCWTNFFPGHLSGPHHKNHFIVRWAVPPTDFVKLNFDGSCQGSSASGGFILRDWMARLLLVGSYNYGTTTITVAEARAI